MREMKKFTTAMLLTLVLALGAILAGCGGGGSQLDMEALTGEYSREFEGTELNVFNWGEYISDGSEGSLDVNTEFEKLTGIKVNYSTYESNEAMYAKMKSGAVSYDIIIPSDYMIQRMISEDMLQPLDFSKLSNYHYIDEQYKDLYFDPENEYSVPYSVGMVGLIYNSTMVEEAPTSWTAMWDERYTDDILTFNNSRDSFSIAQLILGQDVNSTNLEDWDAAAELLKEQNDVLQARVMDEIFNKMEAGNAAIAAYYAGDYVLMNGNNEDLAFVYPEEGTTYFVDSVCVPANAQHYEAAMMYINFLLETQISTAIAEYTYYASPHTGTQNNPDYTLRGDEILYPTEDQMPEVQYFEDLDPEVRSYYEKLWEEILRD
ncbi:MAG: spermidine/putrescine ABC transporter substrate-binding protein [Firmicutes bacterium]|nr:spermidine/putrescine ABC transporter substrate-binding protein [Bacillota bacterium]